MWEGHTDNLNQKVSNTDVPVCYLIHDASVSSIMRIMAESSASTGYRSK